MLKELRHGWKIAVNWLKKHGATLFISIVILTTVFFWLFLADHWNEHVEGEVHAFFYFISGFATSAIFLGSWVQLKGINKKNKADFLLEIDKRWCSEEITAVRKELWTMYTKNRKGMGTTQDNISDLLEAHKTVDEHLKENIDTLFRHLNFIELLGAIHAGNYLTKAELRVIYGGQLENYLRFYEKYLTDLNNSNNSNDSNGLNNLNAYELLKLLKQ